jgi:hypothetical protein
VNLGLTLQLLRKAITDEKAIIRYPIVTDCTPLTIGKFVGSLLTKQELRGNTLDYCFNCAHKFVKVELDYCDYIYVFKKQSVFMNNLHQKDNVKMSPDKRAVVLSHYLVPGPQT